MSELPLLIPGPQERNAGPFVYPRPYYRPPRLTGRLEVDKPER